MVKLRAVEFGAVILGSGKQISGANLGERISGSGSRATDLEERMSTGGSRGADLRVRISRSGSRGGGSRCVKNNQKRKIVFFWPWHTPETLLSTLNSAKCPWLLPGPKNMKSRTPGIQESRNPDGNLRIQESFKIVQNRNRLEKWLWLQPQPPFFSVLETSRFPGSFSELPWCFLKGPESEANGTPGGLRNRKVFKTEKRRAGAAAAGLFFSQFSELVDFGFLSGSRSPRSHGP